MELNYKEFGQGDPLIILHGLFGTLDNWQTIAKKLAEHYSVYIIDQRNHGRSPHDEAFDYAVMAEDLHQFMESQWIYKAHILGHSMGGKTAMQFAMEYPDMIDQLMIIDIAPKKYKGGHQLIFDALFDLNLKTLAGRKEADEQLSKKINDFSVRQFLLKNLSREKVGGYRWKMNLDAIHKNYQKILDPIPNKQAFETSTLFVRGGRSDYIIDSDWEMIEKQFTQSTLKTVENAGHWIHAEAPKELLTLLYDFLNLEPTEI